MKSVRGALSSILVALGLLRRRANVLCVGLDNSGKSTMIQHFKGTDGCKEDVIPTVGFSVESFSSNRISFTAFDMSGQGKYRDLWKHYYPETDAIIFVVDASDRERAAVVRDELDELLGSNVCKSRQIPILFLANKMDLPGVLSPAECADALGLERVKDRAWTIGSCNALSGEGLEHALDWLAGVLRDAI
ncbi:hypothetical protein BASA50_000737 [Batrachochytrium salamandrivorans]|uniref:ADP-ribosylation factor-like protein 6 n=1 Tax=Batrachochytrium salamandrivorans TaxID=1357716 RepID=A0ABQ8ETE3_9FUNG|nr:hypothetical protein BASA62_008024 [Batrachochytrium salamandrivorans]KAH6575795.1 hypothetical protein BASA60_004846 [Batrachochytrium salamandrivorans]KAH6585283.1 hypothetical protein BASA61_006925 [Batrachochytrium salamandrivorans]KAH6586272.1 hypothetical protein BASA50_000737 [Batrachochytrium salamandrivorans]KAH9254922.1 hypothetical protein BASA81_006988 [Batrachochytrium salamandrivorans]